MKTEKGTVTVSMTRSYNYQSATYGISEEIILEDSDDRDEAIREATRRSFVEVVAQTGKAHAKFVEAAKG